MKPEYLIFLSAESIPFGLVIETPRPLTLAPRRIPARIAAGLLVFGGLACLVWVALGYVAAV